jgi:hypothetical protein
MRQKRSYCGEIIIYVGQTGQWGDLSEDALTEREKREKNDKSI